MILLNLFTEIVMKERMTDELWKVPMILVFIIADDSYDILARRLGRERHRRRDMWCWRKTTMRQVV